MFERDRGHLQWHYGEFTSHTNLRPVKLGLRSASLHKARDQGLTQGVTFLQFPFPSSLRNIRLCATINPGHSHPRMPCEVGVVLPRSAPCSGYQRPLTNSSSFFLSCSSGGKCCVLIKDGFFRRLEFFFTHRLWLQLERWSRAILNEELRLTRPNKPPPRTRYHSSISLLCRRDPETG